MRKCGRKWKCSFRFEAENWLWFGFYVLERTFLHYTHNNIYCGLKFYYLYFFHPVCCSMVFRFLIVNTDIHMHTCRTFVGCFFFFFFYCNVFPFTIYHSFWMDMCVRNIWLGWINEKWSCLFQFRYHNNNHKIELQQYSGDDRPMKMKNDS